MYSLRQLTQEVTRNYGQLSSLNLLSQTISMCDSGLLRAGKKEYPLTSDANQQFARFLGVPADFYTSTDSDIRAMIFNRMFQKAVEKRKISDLRLTLKNQNILGYDDPTLHKIAPVALMNIFYAALPIDLSDEDIVVPHAVLTDTTANFSCITPTISVQPQVGDIINGGIDIHHSVTGAFATQVRCYFNRLICKNGATVHICADNAKKPRSRRLPNHKFSQADMVMQLRSLIVKAWRQLEQKLTAIKSLTEQPRTPLDFLHRYKSKYSLNEKIIKRIEDAITEDELKPTNTQYDNFNAISRIATHNKDLTLCQQKNLSRFAGEFSQHHVHRCNQCGSWVTEQNET